MHHNSTRKTKIIAMTPATLPSFVCMCFVYATSNYNSLATMRVYYNECAVDYTNISSLVLQG